MNKKDNINIALVVLALLAGLLLVSCRSITDEGAAAAPVAAGEEAQTETEAENIEAPKTLSDQLIGTWSLTKSDIQDHPHFYQQFTKDGVTCFDVSVEWLGKLVNRCMDYSLDGSIMTMVCPEEASRVCFAGETCNNKVIITEGDTLILEPDEESCTDFWKNYGARRVDIPHFERVVQ